MKIIVFSSKLPVDDDTPLPWEYSIAGFKSWVFEVLQNCTGDFPKNSDQAKQIAEEFGYEVTDSYSYAIRDRLPIASLTHGSIYKLISRNLTVGAWDSSNNFFIGVRRKFGKPRLDTENHYDGNDHPTASPMECIGSVPDDIDITDVIFESKDPVAQGFHKARLFEILTDLEKKYE